MHKWSEKAKKISIHAPREGSDGKYKQIIFANLVILLTL